ncbi:MAG: hypothetical protein KC502_09900 [Myxococcales bacterium]|nr:hypothetical protein [Myxococcales bacterium]
MVGAIRAQVADKDLGLLSHLGKRLGKPAPPIVWQLLKRKRAGATEEELLAFIRTRFPKDLRLRAETVAWLERQAGGGATPADVLPKNRLSPERRARLRRVLERVGRGVRKQAANKTP